MLFFNYVHLIYGFYSKNIMHRVVDNVDKSVQNSIFPKKGRKWVCKTYPQNWGQNVDNVDNKKAEHIFCATCLVYHKVGRLEEEKTFYLDRQGGGVLQQAP